MEEMLFIGAAVRHEMLKRKLALVLRCHDLFNVGRFEHISRGTGFYTHNSFNREYPMITLSLTYKINNYKKQYGGSDLDNTGDDSGGYF
jgi:hypothetical protein